jgi:thioredoxin-dependent peroxiredoxin
MKVKAGEKAPGFVLPDQEGRVHKLADYKGQWVLVYFYPKDDTTGCTREACAIRDEWPNFEKADLKVFGISADSPKSHAKFAEKYELPFTLLADENKEVIHAYGVWGPKSFMGNHYEGIFRQSVLIDPKGKVAKVYEKVKPAEHAKEVLADLKNLT